MADTTFLVESVRKLRRRGATSDLLNMLRRVRAAEPAGLLAIFGLAWSRRVGG